MSRYTLKPAATMLCAGWGLGEAVLRQSQKWSCAATVTCLVLVHSKSCVAWALKDE